MSEAVEHLFQYSAPTVVDGFCGKRWVLGQAEWDRLDNRWWESGQPFVLPDGDTISSCIRATTCPECRDDGEPEGYCPRCRT